MRIHLPFQIENTEKMEWVKNLELKHLLLMYPNSISSTEITSSTICPQKTYGYEADSAAKHHNSHTL